MHELGIASTIIEAVKSEAEKHAGARPCRVCVRIGELAAVDPESLRFAFDVLTRDTALADLILEIQTCPLRYRCSGCGELFSAKEFLSVCPRCGGAQTVCVGGDELDLAYLEIENEPCATRTQSPQ